MCAELTHVDCRCYCVSFVGRMLLLPLPLPHRHCFMVGKFSSSSAKWMWKSSCDITLYAIPALPFWVPRQTERDGGRRPTRETETERRWSAKNAFRARRNGFVRALFFRFRFKLHTRFVKWAHKMIVKDDSTESNSHMMMSRRLENR